MREALGSKWYSTYLKDIFDMFLNTDEVGYVRMSSFYVTVSIDEVLEKLWQISRPSLDLWEVSEYTIQNAYYSSRNAFDSDAKAYKHVLGRIHEIKMGYALE